MPSRAEMGMICGCIHLAQNCAGNIFAIRHLCVPVPLRRYWKQKARLSLLSLRVFALNADQQSHAIWIHITHILGCLLFRPKMEANLIFADSSANGEWFFVFFLLLVFDVFSFRNRWPCTFRHRLPVIIPGELSILCVCVCVVRTDLRRRTFNSFVTIWTNKIGDERKSKIAIDFCFTISTCARRLPANQMFSHKINNIKNVFAAQTDDIISRSSAYTLWLLPPLRPSATVRIDDVFNVYVPPLILIQWYSGFRCIVYFQWEINMNDQRVERIRTNTKRKLRFVWSGSNEITRFISRFEKKNTLLCGILTSHPPPLSPPSPPSFAWISN